MLIKQLEMNLAGLRQLRGYVGKGVGSHVLEILIEEGEAKLTEVKKRLVN